MIRRFGTLFVVQVATNRDFGTDALVPSSIHQVLAALRGLNFKRLLFSCDLVRAGLVLLDSTFQIGDFLGLLRFDHFKFLTLNLCLLLILLPLLDQGQVIIFKLVQVLLQLVRFLESQLVLFVRVVVLKKWLKRFRVFNLVLCKEILLRILLSVCSPSLGRDRTSSIRISKSCVSSRLSTVACLCLTLDALFFSAPHSPALLFFDLFFGPKVIEELFVSVVSVQLL